MKSILGFTAGKYPEPEQAPAAEPVVPQPPVRTLVKVNFPDSGKTLSYYNDRFDLRKGDIVFVEGKLAGEPGIVESVSRKFKISLSDYKRVISVADRELHGSYEEILDKMVSFDREAFSPEQYRTWVLPPKEEEDDEVIFGEGFDLDLTDIERNPDVTYPVLQRAFEYCNSGKVAYICIRDGIGTAFISGSEWYEVNVRLEGSLMREMYCDCPYPGLCKHLLAVAVTLRELSKQDGFNLENDFVAMDTNRFWGMVAHTRNKITL